MAADAGLRSAAYGSRGLAQAVVLAAIAGAREAGYGAILIAADADDWPWRLYAKLGFEPVGEITMLRRLPEPKSE